MKKTQVFLTTFIAYFLFSYPVYAEVIKVPLYKFAPVKPVDLKCVAGEYGIPIPLPERWNVKRAVLSFDYVNSTALLAGRSRMAIRINGYPVSQINLNPLAPEGSVKLSIPVFLLEHGYNNLSFHVYQHYMLECEDPCASELWTTLKLDKAYLEIEYTLKPVPLRLSSISSFLFDPKISPHGEVHIVMENTTPETVSLAGIAASGVARRFDYRNVFFSVSKDIVPGYDNILIGSRDFVQNLLRARGLNITEIKGPFLKIMHMPGNKEKADTSHALIIVSGMNLDQAKLAVETLAIMSSSLPDTDEMIAVEFTLPDIPIYGGRGILVQDKKHTFKDLDFPTHVFKGMSPQLKEIVFRLPADFLIKPNLYVDISLYYAYGAGLRSDSVLNIVLNGKYIKAIHLDDVRGGIVEGYKISVPTYMFKPGTNVLGFESVLTPSKANLCEYFQVGNLFLTLFEDSTIYFPPMPHFVDLPKIELFMLNGFPITRWPDGHGSMIYLTNPDFNTISSALNLIGIITQKNGYPLFEIKFTYDDPKKFNGELIVLGDINTVPESFRKNAPLKILKETTVPYPIVRSWSSDVALAYSKQISSLNSGKGVVMEFQSPYAAGRTVLLFTAASTGDLLALTEAVMEPAVQAMCEGDLVFIDLSPPDYKISSLRVGKKYFSGKAGKVSKIGMYLHVYPYLYYLAVALLIIFLSLVVFYLLMKYRKKRVQG